MQMAFPRSKPLRGKLLHLNRRTIGDVIAYDLNANDIETITVLLTSATVEIRGYFLMRLYKLLLAHKVAVVYPSSTTELVQDFPHVAGITVTKKER
jgi:hypothetical protein